MASAYHKRSLGLHLPRRPIHSKVLHAKRIGLSSRAMFNARPVFLFQMRLTNYILIVALSKIGLNSPTYSPRQSYNDRSLRAPLDLCFCIE